MSAPHDGAHAHAGDPPRAGEALLEISGLRKRYGSIEALKGLRDHDDGVGRSFLDAVEAGSMAPEEAARRIRELNGGA